MQIKYVALVLLLLTANQVLSCADILPADISQFKIPKMANGTSTGIGGITDFSHKNDDCTLDCKCVYNNNTHTWGVSATPNKTCVFMNQCKRCKSTDTICEIRFVDDQSSSRYQAKYFANDPNRSDVKRCFEAKANAIQCENFNSLPSYDSVKPLNHF